MKMIFCLQRIYLFSWNKPSQLLSSKEFDIVRPGTCKSEHKKVLAIATISIVVICKAFAPGDPICIQYGAQKKNIDFGSFS